MESQNFRNKIPTGNVCFTTATISNSKSTTKQLPVSTHVKYLGINIDSKLNWRENI